MANNNNNKNIYLNKLQNKKGASSHLSFDEKKNRFYFVLSP